MMSRGVLCAAIVACLVGTTGCGKIREKIAQKAVEKAIETGSGGSVNIDDDKVTFGADKDRALTVGRAAKLPDGWPSDVPSYPGATIVAAVSDGTKARTAIFETTDSVDQASAFYEQNLSAFKKEGEVDLGGHKQMSFKDAAKKRTVMVAVGKSSKAASKTTVSLIVADGV